MIATTIKETSSSISFSDKWWDDFLQESEDFTQTKVFKNVIDDATVEMLNNEVMNILREIYSHKTNNYGFRVYIDGKTQDADYILQLFNHPPLPEEDITAYTERMFPDKKFGMIINRTEKFSNAMGKKVMSLIQPLLNKVGIPLTGMNAHILLGNYGFTPLGIHQDTKGDNVIHLHLGPAKKIMYNWDANIYKDLTDNKANNEDIEPLLEHAEEYSFETGDLYYMPWNKWHVGLADELSVGLTIWFNNPTREKYTSKILEALRLQYFTSEQTVLKADKDFMSDKSFDYILSCIQMEQHLKDMSFKDLLQYIHKEYTNSIASNGGWENLPLTLKDTNGYDIETGYTILKEKSIVAPYPFKLYHKIEADSLVIFARGYKVKVKYHPHLVVILDMLNTNKTMQVTELLAPLQQEWPLEAGLYFLSLLYDKQAIEITN